MDRVGAMLAKLLGMLLHKELHNPEEMEKFVQQFRTEMDIDPDAFVAMNEVDSLRFLVQEKKFSVEHLRTFGNILYDMAQKVGYSGKRDVLLKKALSIYEYVSANSGGTLYLDVLYKINELKQ